MRGTNVFEFNQVQMCEIVQHWLNDKVMPTAMQNNCVAHVSFDGSSGVFRCRIEEVSPAKKEPKPNA